ncbi:MAG: ATP phosphoribosyltransferase [Oscillospiraceae bacterium]|nr:ATP phosphoribosyltransferase [Oscillospiraceae bacterium]
MIKIALTKGRLEEQAIKLFEKSGYDASELKDKGRKLLFEIKNAAIELVLAKAADVTTYVEHGVCDIGIVGKDTIMECGKSFYEVLNLNFGKCRFALAGPVGKNFYGGYSHKIIATKYPNVAKRYFNEKGLDVEIVKIEGSVELAPILGLSDGIVDIVETGGTLKENGLVIIEEIAQISARVIVNKTSIKLKKNEVDEFIGRIGKNVENI